MINVCKVTIPTSVLKTDDYAKLCYIYALADDTGTPYYVGSSNNPTSRYLTHLAGNCKDSAPTTLALLKRGKQPTMVLLDVGLPRTNSERYQLEGYQIARLRGLGYPLSNTCLYQHHADYLRDHPTAVKSQTLGTLA